jgi:hypothetical protein
MQRRRFLALAAAAVAARPTLAAPRGETWPRWEAHDPASRETVDHGIWASLLAERVSTAPDGVNRFAYGAVGAAGRKALRGYIAALAGTAVSRLARPEQMAFWINLYNAVTVQCVLDHYPVGSIRDIDISPGPLANGPWGAKLVEVEGERLSLDDIEHRILRPIWRDPRIHYGVNCAAIGCPNLLPQPFVGARLDRMLDGAALAYVNHPRGVSLAGDRLTVSSIYVWYREDFGGSDEGVIRHLKAYARPDLAMELENRRRIDGDAYDWTLNDAANA